MDNKIIPQDLVIGIDVSASWVDLFCFHGQVPGSIRSFYESADFEKHHSQWPMGMEVVRHILELQPVAVVLEPTGSYSKYLCEKFTEYGIPYLLADQTLIKQTRKGLAGTDNKDDAFDAILLQDLYWDKWEGRRYDRRYWVEDRPEIIKQLKAKLDEIKTAQKKANQSINTIKQRLAAGEWLEKSTAVSKRTRDPYNPNRPPSLYQWLAGWSDGNHGDWEPENKIGLGKIKAAYQRATERGEAREISTTTRELARMICICHRLEMLSRAEVETLLKQPCFKIYHQVFDDFGFDLKERAWILTRIYPFSKFLDEDGGSIINYKRKNSNGNRSKQHRSKRRFRQSLGLGRVDKHSGSSVRGGSNLKGSADARGVLWYWVKRELEMKRGHDGKFNQPIAQRRNGGLALLLLDWYWLKRAYEVLTDGRLKKIANAVDARNATTRKVADLLFSELLKTFQQR